MRPRRLEFEGFTAFRDRTVIDFEGADLFALCGPTGAGKTTVIDGITFALYGKVPRLDDLRAVAPVISQGRVEARVRLDFTVGDTSYAAVRVVRATKAGGATTKEARLERADGEVLADDADHVSTAVAQLLGLDFRQFTTCVSLPQGEFARFLHDKPRDRQDLLVRLLELGLYDLVATAARQRAAVDHDRVALAESRLAQLAGATPEAIADAVARTTTLSALRDRVEAAQPQLDALRTAIDQADREAGRIAADAVKLEAVVVPKGIDTVAERVRSAVEAYDAARTTDTQAAEAVAKAEAGLAALPTRAAIEGFRRDHDDAAQLASQIEKGAVALAASKSAATAAADALASAEVAVAEAIAARDSARSHELAHTLAAELVVGDPCPVCQQTVGKIPGRAAPAKVATAEKAVTAAEKALVASRKAAADTSTEQARVEQKCEGLEAQRVDVVKRLKKAPDIDTLAAQLEDLTTIEATIDDAKKAATAARDQRDKAEGAVDAARIAEQKARAQFDKVRDSVASMTPPPAARNDLHADWSALATWASAKRPELDDAVAALREAVVEHRTTLDALRDGLAAECREAGLEPGDRPRDVVVDALVRVEAEHRQLQADHDEAETLRTTVAQTVEAVGVARTLADHLAANRFEQWLLDAVLQQLVTGATMLLRDLSGGAYSLIIDERTRSFAVVDHVNADAVRPARTLSGGETFLASLALALALAEQVMLVAGSSSRLETILLDEGFGTLDLDTLEIVAAALEELGARGRMVGIVTHVRELAERLPVRFEIRKVAGAATVERVEA